MPIEWRDDGVSQEDYAKIRAEQVERKKRLLERLLMEVEEQEFCIMEIVEAYRKCGMIEDSFALNRLLRLVKRELAAAFDKNIEFSHKLMVIEDKMDKGKFDKISTLCDEIISVLDGRWLSMHNALKGKIGRAPIGFQTGEKLIMAAEKDLERVLNKTSDILSLRPF